MVRGVAERYGLDGLDPREIARGLTVRHQVEGTMARKDDRVRVTVHLVDGL